MKGGELGLIDKVYKSNNRRNSTRFNKILKPFLQGDNNDFDPQTEADR